MTGDGADLLDASQLFLLANVVNFVGCHSLLVCSQSSWMNHIEKDHDKEHRNRVEDVQKDLMPQQVAIIAHQVLDDSKEGSDDDKSRTCVQGDQILLPILVIRSGKQVRAFLCLADANVEDNGHCDKQAEE